MNFGINRIFYDIFIICLDIYKFLINHILLFITKYASVVLDAQKPIVNTQNLVVTID